MEESTGFPWWTLVLIIPAIVLIVMVWCALVFSARVNERAEQIFKGGDDEHHEDGAG